MTIINHIKISKLNLFIVLFSLLLYPLYNIILFDLLSLSEVEKMPKGLRQTMCGCINKNNFSLNFNHIWANVINIIGVKRSVFGSCSDKFVVVKTRTGFSDSRFMDLDILTHLGLDDIRSKVKKFLTTENCSTSIEKFTLCPSLDSIDLFFSYQYVNDYNLLNNFRSTLNLSEYIHIFYTMQLSMEPIIQQITKQWAVAEYLGNCGVFTVSKYCGDSLTSTAPSLKWADRSSIAVQLLEFAFNATFGNPHFSFYFTDMTADNFAVSLKGDIKLVDLDNVIVVDKYPRDPPNDWEELHENRHDDSEIGFIFSPKKICSHKISDLNIYSICQGILSDRSDHINGGLLHSPPVLSNIKNLVEECILSPKGKTRFHIARLIIEQLTKKENTEYSRN